MKKPNILIIVSDQLSQRVVGAYGSQQGLTDAIDAVAERGVTFSDAYTPCPLCMPARAAFWTGRYPHETGVPTNFTGISVSDDMPTLGNCLTKAGYSCAHFGKTHDCGGLRGFEPGEYAASEVEETPPWQNYYDTTEDRSSAEQTAAFLAKDHDGPFCVVADLNNPHDICLWIGDHIGPHEDEPIPGELPELPANFEMPDPEGLPDAVRNNAAMNFRVAQTEGWTPENYRYYLAAYYHYVDMFNRDAASVLDALYARADADNTVILLVVDHGEGIASHGMVTKSGHFYEECTRVPLIIGGAGIEQPGRSVKGPLVTTLDLVPTLCEIAGIEAPETQRGRSLVPYLKNRQPDAEREYVVSTWGESKENSNPGRMIRTARYKYAFYSKDSGEQLYDLESDPGEMRNLARSPEHAAILDEHRSLLKHHCAETSDSFDLGLL